MPSRNLRTLRAGVGSVHAAKAGSRGLLVLFERVVVVRLVRRVASSTPGAHIDVVYARCHLILRGRYLGAILPQVLGCPRDPKTGNAPY